MNHASRIVIALVGVGVLAALIGEDLSRRHLAQRYREALDGRRQVELQYGEAVATHQQLQHALDQEQRRSRELGDALLATRGQLEEVVGRLAEETKSANEITARFASLQQQLDQLQGELAVTLQHQGQAASRPGPTAVQLERIVVSSASAASSQGRVVSIHPEWGFVVVSLGWDAVHIGDTISIFRKDQLLAKARIERVQEGASAATLLSDWKSADIRVNDIVRIL